MRLRAFAFTALLSLSLHACGKAPGPQPVPVIIPDSTKVADVETRSKLLAYDSASGDLRFSGLTATLDKLRPGDVLVSEPAAAAPYGFLLKVTGEEADAAVTVVHTEPASLEDAIRQADISHSGSLTPEMVTTATAHLSGVRIERAVPKGEYGFQVTIDHQLSAGAGPAGAKVRLQGEIRFNAGYEVGISIRPRFGIPPAKIKDVHARIGFDERASVKLTGQAGGGLGVELKIATFTFSPIVFAVGPIPVVIVPSIDVLLGASGQVTASLNYEAVQVAKAQLGVAWNPDDGWQNLSGREFSLDAPSKPTAEASMKAKAYGKANGSFMFYGVAGPQVSFQAGAEVDAAVPRNPTWIMNGFVKGDLVFLVKLPVFGTIAEYRGNLFDWSTEFYRAPNKPPVVSITAPVSGAAVPYGGLGGTSFNASVADTEDGSSCCTVTWASSVDGPIGSGTTINYAFPTPGTRTVTVTATDSQGATNSQSVVVTAGNVPPTVTISAPSASGTYYPGVSYSASALANDPNEPGIGCSSIRWSSSVPGDSFGSGCNTTVGFSGTGTRTLMAFSSDSQGATGSASVTLTVVNLPAGTAQITSPANGSEFASATDGTGYSADVPFSGSATYSSGDTVPGISLKWFANGSTLLGTGNEITARLSGSACSATSYTITLRSYNPDGTVNSTSSAITIWIARGRIC